MEEQNLSNKMLMERIKKSNQKAFELLYDRFWEQMYTKAFSILKDEFKSKEFVQEVWISIWERRFEIENDNIEGYLFNALRFKIYNEFRNTKNKNVLIEDFIKSCKSDNISNNIDDVINLYETQYLITSLVEKLPKKCQEVFKLSRYDGLKNNEISKKLSISQRTVETHISNALKVLKNNIALGLAFIINFFIY